MVEINTTGPLMECVPNFSEGRNAAVVEAIVSSMALDGIRLLDWSLDSDHNRSVVTVVGPPSSIIEAAIRAAGKAAELIDLTVQEGEHPRIGAADVIPFVPVQNCSLEQCALAARQAGMEIWKRFGVPAYFYEAAAARPDRALLEDVRRGQFEGLRDAVKKEAARRPDVGGPDLHPTAGASAIGARRFLVAYNLYLKTHDVSIARSIAREIRASSGGLKGVKAIGVLAHGIAQVSMNITNFRETSITAVFEAVKRLSQRQKVEISHGELIGLIPEDAYERESEWARLLVDFDPDKKILESRLQSPLPWPEAALR